jgi:hypothetical protein
MPIPRRLTAALASVALSVLALTATAAPSSATPVATPGIPGPGTWATVTIDGTQLRVVPRLDGGHDLIEDQTDPASTCVWAAVDYRTDVLLRSADLTFTGAGACSDGSGGTADVTIHWTAYGGYRLGAHGLERSALVRLCEVTAPTDCIAATGTIGIGTIS